MHATFACVLSWWATDRVRLRGGRSHRHLRPWLPPTHGRDGSGVAGHRALFGPLAVWSTGGAASQQPQIAVRHGHDAAPDKPKSATTAIGVSRLRRRLHARRHHRRVRGVRARAATPRASVFAGSVGDYAAALTLGILSDLHHRRSRLSLPSRHRHRSQGRHALAHPSKWACSAGSPSSPSSCFPARRCVLAARVWFFMYHRHDPRFATASWSTSGSSAVESRNPCSGEDVGGPPSTPFVDDHGGTGRPSRCQPWLVFAVGRCPPCAPCGRADGPCLRSAISGHQRSRAEAVAERDRSARCDQLRKTRRLPDSGAIRLLLHWTFAWFVRLSAVNADAEYPPPRSFRQRRGRTLWMGGCS